MIGTIGTAAKRRTAVRDAASHVDRCGALPSHSIMASHVAKNSVRTIVAECQVSGEHHSVLWLTPSVEAKTSGIEASVSKSVRACSDPSMTARGAA